MRRLFILATVALLGFAPLGVRSVSAQSWQGSEAWQGVTVQEPVAFNAVSPSEAFLLLADFLGEPTENMAAGTMSMSAQLDEVYPVELENMAGSDHRALIPEVVGAEFMVVIVDAGEFVLDVKGPGSFLVDPVIDAELSANADQRIRIMHATILGTEIHYTPTDQFVLDEKGQECTSLCTVLPGVAVQLTDGDRIIAPAGAICIWCLLNQDEHAGEALGQLYVFPLLDADETFSWSEYDGGSGTLNQESAPASSESATLELMIGAAPWAFFNPSPNCRSP